MIERMTNTNTTSDAEAIYRGVSRTGHTEIPARSLQECVAGLEHALGLVPGRSVTVQDGPREWRLYAAQAHADLDAPQLEPSSWIARIAFEGALPGDEQTPAG